MANGIITFHGVFIAAALILMILYAFYYTAQKKYDSNILMYLTPVSIFFGFAGARFMYVTVWGQLLYPEEADKWRLSDGGYALYGAIAGVILTVVGWWLITKRRGKPLQVFDTLCASAPLAIALGRIGSIFSGDCFGETVETEGLRFFPVAIYKTSDMSYHYAVFFYEAVFCVLIFFFIRYADKKVKISGTSTYLFTVLYCSGRAFFETLREDSMYIGHIRINQVISILTVIAAFVFISIKLCKLTGFKLKYVISYVIVFASFVVAFFSVFYMYSSSVVWNTVQIMICCIIIAATVSYTGMYYAYRLTLKQRAEKRKRIYDQTQQFKKVKRSVK